MPRDPAQNRTVTERGVEPLVTVIAAAMILLLRGGAWSAPGPRDADAAERLLAVAGDGFRIRETEHFTIAYDTPYEALRPLVGRLEGTYNGVRQFCERHGLGCGPSAVRLQVILFDRFEDFARYSAGVGVSARSVAGFYHQPTNIAAFCNTESSPGLRGITAQIKETRERLNALRRNGMDLSRVRRQRREFQRQLSTLQLRRAALVKRFNRFVIQHEAAHQMLFHFAVHVRGGDNPTWLVEGLACQFEVPQAGHRGALKRVNQMRLGDYREALGADAGARSVSEAQVETALANGRLLPLVDLISKPNLFATGAADVAFRYAQAWALVFYLQHEYPEQFAVYLRLLQKRRVGEVVGRRQTIEEFQSVFGEPGAEWERAWRSHMLRLRVDPREGGP